MIYGKWNPLRRTEEMGKLAPSRKPYTDWVIVTAFHGLFALIFSPS